jgi:hypothetical protein
MVLDILEDGVHFLVIQRAFRVTEDQAAGD